RRFSGRCSGGVTCSARSSPQHKLGTPMVLSTSTSSWASRTRPLPSTWHTADLRGAGPSYEEARAVLGRQHAAWPDATHVKATASVGFSAQGQGKVSVRSVHPAARSVSTVISGGTPLGMHPLRTHCYRGLGTLYAQTDQAEQARAALSTA